MSVSIQELADKLGYSVKELKTKIIELGFEVKLRAKNIEKELANLIEEELTETTETTINNDEVTEVYEELISKELDREIIKQQRKKTAGKEKEKEIKTEEKQKTNEDPKEKIIEIPLTISVKEFAEKAGISPAKVIGELMKNGIISNINKLIDYETAAIIAGELGVEIKKKREAADIEDVMEGNLENLLKEENKKDLEERAPIVTVMGHVDHGKTKLLDYIRKANVAEGEAGGITQHIGAYQAEVKNKKITFLDTPGHEAFTAMRARGAKITDIAILVVAGDEGVKPQTIEAIDHAKEAKVPIIVAVNKMDKDGFQPDKVKGELAEHGLQPEDWGGDVPMVPISALTGEGIDNLLDTILIVAEMADLKANPNRPAVATVLESHLEPSLGPVANIIINTGTLNLMDNFTVGSTYGRVKVMLDYKGKRIKSIGPSGAVRIAGITRSPRTGDILQVVINEKIAKEQALKIGSARELIETHRRGFGMDEIVARINEGNLKTLKIVLKVDTKGSLEAAKEVLSKVRNEAVALQIIHSGVGNVTESDVMMAAASKGIVVGFHNEVSINAKNLAERYNVEILTYNIIYKLSEELTKLVSGLLEPEIVTVEVGTAEVKEVFWTKKNESILGCLIKQGKMTNRTKLIVFRKEEEVGTGEIDSLQKGTDSVKEIGEGAECGIRFKGNLKPEPGDLLKAYKTEKKMRSL